MRSFRLVSIAALAGLLLGVVPVIAATPAGAVGGYHISSGVWNVRSSVGGGVIGSVRGGQAIDIECQQIGPAVSISGFGTSTVYDRLSSPIRGYVSDLSVSETPYARRDPRIPECGGAAPAPAPSGAELAARRAEARVGQVYTSENRNRNYWSGWCETFAEVAWSNAFRYGSADANFAAHAGRIQGGVPPRGALVFYTPNHIGVSVGGGQVVATQGYDNQRLPIVRVGYTYFSGYRGWSMP